MRSFTVTSGSDSFIARYYDGVGAAFRFDGYTEQATHDSFEVTIMDAIRFMDADGAVVSVNVICPEKREWEVARA